MRGKEFRVRFWQAKGGGIFDENTVDFGFFELFKSLRRRVYEQVFDDLEEEGNGVLIDTFVKGLLTG